jgi:hypothetical protein
LVKIRKFEPYKGGYVAADLLAFVREVVAGYQSADGDGFIHDYENLRRMMEQALSKITPSSLRGIISTNEV